MKNLVKKSMVPAFASALLILAAGQAQAVSVSVEYLGIGSGSLPYDAPGVILEDFEGVVNVGSVGDSATGWYQSLETNVGTFTAGGEVGIGSTSYNAITGLDDEDPWFRIRDFDDNGRFNTTPDGANYLDSADITELTLALDPGYNNIFFTVTDPSDVKAVTTINGVTDLGFDGVGDPDGGLYLVKITSDIELAEIKFGVSHQNDGFAVDDFGTSVPEPATALLFGAGLIPLMGFLRRKKEEEEV